MNEVKSKRNKEKGTEVKIRKFNRTKVNLFLDILIIIFSVIVMAVMKDRMVVVIFMIAIILSRIYYIFKGYKEIMKNGSRKA